MSSGAAIREPVRAGQSAGAPGEAAPVLRRIAPGEVRLGHFIHAIDGSWLSHPFWKTKFVLADPADLAALRASAVEAVLIDEARSVVEAEVRPAPPPASQAAVRVTERAPASPKAPSADPAPLPQSCSVVEEVARAAQIVNRSKRVVMQMFNQARLGRVIETARVLSVVDEISSSVARNSSALVTLARLKTADDYTYLHSVAVCALMVNLARQLRIGDEALVRELGVAGLLHDIGKIGIPGQVLNKPGRLSDEEFALMREHPGYGHRLLRDAGTESEIVLDVCLHHHERIDGRGYPDGLSGDAIGMFARMGAICDVYDAVTSQRAYKTAWEAGDSLARMLKWEGHFDPAILRAFIRSMGVYPVGTLVRLRSDHLALVLELNAEDLTRPVVRVFHSIAGAARIPVRDLDLMSPSVDDSIVSRESPRDWNLMPWKAQWSALMGLGRGLVAGAG
ncbi:MAG: HD-GYP domain-containing protein [Burkholderiaceae bacterium]|nr:HD-GYP domain-containing protein [Burkholderiaceae bacterium]